jgi:hypothetical protein
MPSAPFSVTEALELGNFILAAYDLFAANDPPIFIHRPSCASAIGRLRSRRC